MGTGGSPTAKALQNFYKKTEQANVFSISTFTRNEKSITDQNKGND